MFKIFPRDVGEAECANQIALCGGEWTELRLHDLGGAAARNPVLPYSLDPE